MQRSPSWVKSAPTASKETSRGRRGFGTASNRTSPFLQEAPDEPCRSDAIDLDARTRHPNLADETRSGHNSERAGVLLFMRAPPFSSGKSPLGRGAFRSVEEVDPANLLETGSRLRQTRGAVGGTGRLPALRGASGIRRRAESSTSPARGRPSESREIRRGKRSLLRRLSRLPGRSIRNPRGTPASGERIDGLLERHGPDPRKLLANLGAQIQGARRQLVDEQVPPGRGGGHGFRPLRSGRVTRHEFGYITCSVYIAIAIIADHRRVAESCGGVRRVTIHRAANRSRVGGLGTLRALAGTAPGAFRGVVPPATPERIDMEYRRLGNSGLRVPALSFGTATFGGGNDFFKAWGSTDAGGASRLIDVCLDHGVSMFDSADVYSDGLAEEILGKAIKGKRDRLLISTKATFPDRRRARTTSARRASTWSTRSTRRCSASAPITSTCSSSTGRTTTPRSRRRSRRSTSSCARARSATSAAPTSPAGT